MSETEKIVEKNKFTSLIAPATTNQKSTGGVTATFQVALVKGVGQNRGDERKYDWYFWDLAVGWIKLLWRFFMEEDFEDILNLCRLNLMEEHIVDSSSVDRDATLQAIERKQRQVIENIINKLPQQRNRQIEESGRVAEEGQDMIPSTSASA